MKKSCYIIGKSLCCNLGNNKQDIISKLLCLNQNNYTSFLENNFKEKAFYKLWGFKKNQESRFFDILKKVIDDAIIDAELSKKEQQELHIFIGSTSMGISINEEQNKKFFADEKEKELLHICYGYLGNFVEEYIQSKYKTTIFSTACTSSVNALSYCFKNDRI